MSGLSSGRRNAGMLVVVLLAGGLGGCSGLTDMLSSRPTAKITGVSLQDINLQSITLLFDVQIGNPYAVPLPLVNVDYALASKGQSFLSGTADIQSTVPAKGSKTVSLPAKVTYVELLKALQGVRPGAVVPYQADLGLSVNAPQIGALRLPLSKQGELPVPAAPEVSLPGIAWDNVTLDHAGGRMTMRLANPNSFALDVSRLNYNLALGGVDVASSSLAKVVHLPAGGGAGELEVPVSFSPKDLGLAVFSMLTGQGASYKLGGDMTVATPFGPMTLPLEKVGQTAFHR